MESAAPASAQLSREQPPLRATNPPRFDLSTDKSKAAFLRYLDEHGYAVVASVADEAEVVAARARFWDAAKMNADDVLNPNHPECNSLWWPNKNTGAAWRRIALSRLCLERFFSQAFAAEPNSITASFAGQPGCSRASATHSPLCTTRLFHAEAMSHVPGMVRQSRSDCVVRRRQRVSPVEVDAGVEHAGWMVACRPGASVIELIERVRF
jgi:hypothetical protein